jgi:hypothetical protein
MANRNDVLLVGLGGAGNNLVDTIVSTSPLFQQLYINTSITDVKSLNSYDEDLKNFMIISTTNGVGRDRQLGKKFAEQYGYNMIDTLLKYQQEHIYLITSLSGGSGSSILSVLLRGIEDMKNDNDFNKNIHLICIIPSLKSSDKLLSNAKETWGEILNYKCVNSMIFIDNDTNLIKGNDEDLRETEINEKFAEIFDSLFDIPIDNGRKFDDRNLGNILNSKGCLYFYELEGGRSSVEVAYSKAVNNSLLPKMFKNEVNTEISREGNTLIKCSYLGISFNDESYNKDYIKDKFIVKNETYIGKNIEKNLIIMSGCYPHFYTMSLIAHELDDRKTNNTNDNDLDFSNFIIKKDIVEDDKIANVEEIIEEQPKQKKRSYKKNLFKR